MATLLSKSVYLRSHASIDGKHVNVAMMTSGGLAPCLSASIAQLSKYWIKSLREGKITGLTLRMYVDGYKGLLTGDSFVIPESEWDNLDKLNHLGGSPIGNSRVKVRRHKEGIQTHSGRRRRSWPSLVENARSEAKQSSANRRRSVPLTSYTSLPFLALSHM